LEHHSNVITVLRNVKTIKLEAGDRSGESQNKSNDEVTYVIPNHILLSQNRHQLVVIDQNVSMFC